MEHRHQILIETVKRLIRRDARHNIAKVLAKSHPADVAYLFRELELRDQHVLFSLVRRLQSRPRRARHRTGHRRPLHRDLGADHHGAAGLVRFSLDRFPLG